MRNLEFVIFCVLAMALTGTALADDGWVTTDARYFTFQAPMHFREMTTEGVPIDTAPGEYLSEDGSIHIYFEYGGMAGFTDDTPKDAAIEKVQVDGSKGQIVTAPSTMSGYQYRVRMKLFAKQGIVLDMAVDCVSAQDAELARKILKTIRFEKSTRQAKTPTHYDAAVNPFTALERAEKEARASGKKVLVIGGGDWCRWCVALESFISKTPEVKAALDRNFVIVEVYYGEKNLNSAFFSRLPRAAGYPHFWVLSSDNKVLHSVNTSNLEDGNGSYDKDRFLYFIQEMGAS